ncbi:MAG: Hsp70 family protein [Firmicutes bacterium]|nr:Hsp70 family protein [Bacillota bacterium]
MAGNQYFGIDLGTTNSLIGVYTGEEFQLIQNRDRMNATPSAVYVRTEKQKVIGQRAVELIKNDPANGAVEFKRSMGHFQERVSVLRQLGFRRSF